jgi:hypothetical protein
VGGFAVIGGDPATFNNCSLAAKQTGRFFDADHQQMHAKHADGAALNEPSECADG